MLNRVANQRAESLLIIAYAFDPESMVFSHQFQIISRLSEQFRHVFVLANKVNQKAVKPNNITTFDLKWKQGSPIKNLIHLYGAFFSVIFRSRKIVLFSFMTETHSMAVGPFTRMFQIPHIIWYAHTSSPIRLKIAGKFANRILTSTSDSFPVKLESLKKKVRAIGQMVNPKTFKFNRERDYESKDRWIHVGRIDPSKKIESLILLFQEHLKDFPDATLTLVGKSTPGNESYEEYLRNRYFDEISSGHIIFKGKQSQTQISSLLNQSDLFIHGFQGSLDKALIEATMSGVSVITFNLAYLREFGGLRNNSLVDENDMNFLRREVKLWSSLAGNQVKAIALRRYQIATSLHSLDQWIEKLVCELKK